MAEAGNRTACDAGCRGRDAVPCVHPHVRRATGATGALREERPSMKTTARHASGTTTRRMTHERARSSSMRGPGLAQLSRRRTPRTQEESLGGSNAYVASCPVPERRVMATTRASAVCSRVHMVRTHGRGADSNQPTHQPINQSTNQPACSVNKDNDIATTTTRPTPNHVRHATPTRPRHQSPARLAVPKTPFVCVPKTPFPFPSLHFLRCSFHVPSALLFFFSLFLICLLVPSPFLLF